MRDNLRDLLPFVRFKKREKKVCRSVLLAKLQVAACNFMETNTPLLCVLHVFKIVQMVTNHTEYHICSTKKSIN